MKTLRSFIYLDNYKMYSISSQLFEGLTEYIVRTENISKREEENQKGPIGSGRILADIIEKNTNETEKKFLHDYSYNLFEDALIKDNKVLEIDQNNIAEKIKEISQFSFVKISGNLLFNDLKIIEDTINNFNGIGEALGYITQKEAFDQEMRIINKDLNKIQDRNQKSKVNSMMKSKSDFKKILKDLGLNMDETFLKHLAYILNYGYHQQFEVQLPIKSLENEFYLFSAQLERNNLKDDEVSIIKKYSRETEKKFKLFGIVTQQLSVEDKNSIFKDFKDEQQYNENPNMKEALMNIISHVTNIETTFIGKMDYEYVIDPIALYMEI